MAPTKCSIARKKEEKTPKLKDKKKWKRQLTTIEDKIQLAKTNDQI